MATHEVEMNEVVSTSEIKSPKVVPFAPILEDWAYYKTEGNFVVAVKTIVTKMYDVGKKSLDGNPQFLVSATNAVVVMTEAEYHTRTKLLFGT